MSTLFNGNKRMGMNISSETFSRGWFSYFNITLIPMYLLPQNFRAVESAKKRNAVYPVKLFNGDSAVRGNIVGDQLGQS